MIHQVVQFHAYDLYTCTCHLCTLEYLGEESGCVLIPHYQCVLLMGRSHINSIHIKHDIIEQTGDPINPRAEHACDQGCRKPAWQVTLLVSIIMM